jgi:hypothetical protein
MKKRDRIGRKGNQMIREDLLRYHGGKRKKLRERKYVGNRNKK